jgi:5-methylcytosine-specific restriction endonuclease McrA
MGTQAFYYAQPRLEDQWRAIILFGRNVASFKFALGKSLIELADQGRDFVTLEELASPFSRYLCDHLRAADRQGTSAQSRFLHACRAFNRGDLPHDELLSVTARLGFVNVLDAFHVVGPGPVPARFFVDERKTRGGISLTDELGALRAAFQYVNLPHEVEARWRLVETSWELNMPRHALSVSYDEAAEMLVVDRNPFERRSVTGCREALNGYQKGTCFYCGNPITVESLGPSVAHVDHFIPHLLQARGLAERNLDGVWNLVLACPSCNLAKSAQVPALPYLERLHTRNEYLIASHHPLRETLMRQTGATQEARQAYLQRAHTDASLRLIHHWTPVQQEEPAL